MSESLLSQIENARKLFGKSAAHNTAVLLKRAQHTRWHTPEDLIRLHEAVLFLRAHPHSPKVLQLADQILVTFEKRTRQFPATRKGEFEYAEVSGIAGTGLSTNFSHPVAKRLAERHPLRIDWNKYDYPDRLARTVANLFPDVFEAWALGRHVDWRREFERAGGSVDWLTQHVDAEVYDLLEMPLRWELGSSQASRSRARIPRSKIFYHDGPYLTRKDISVAGELSKPPLKARRLSKLASKRILDVIVDASAVRYRELYGFEYPDEANVLQSDLGRGIDIFFFGLPRQWRLPHRKYAAGMYFKNGVPLGYVEVIWLGERMEVGFNLYYTFRQGETAWLYVRLMKLFHEQYGVTSFVIDPYQLGHENEEAIESGSFWFYYKLGFRPESQAIARLAHREIKKLNANSAYRTLPATLRRLARGNVVLKATTTRASTR